MRPLLRPGLHALRRNNGDLQIGLDPATAVVLSADGPTRACLSLLDPAHGAPSGSGSPVRPTMDLLASNGLLVDSDRLLPLIPLRPATPSRSERARRRVPTSRTDVAAIARSCGDHCPDRLERRRSTRVSVQALGNPAGGRLAEQLMALLAGAGVRATGTGDPDEVDLGVCVAVGEPHREAVDPWLRSGRPHLLVRMSEGAATVGPFVVPGETACLRCIDAHHTDADRSWPLLVAQYAHCCARDRSDGVPEPVDSLLASVAVAWAARDVTTYAEGGRPSTWSTTLRLEPDLDALATRAWPKHPACGCGWS